MKYLIYVKDRTSGPVPPDPIALNRSVREWVGARLQDGTMDCAYYVLPKMGLCIINADSHETLLTLLRAWPSFAFQEFEIHMLADVRHGIDNNFERLTREGPKAQAEENAA
ncbi:MULTISPECIES: hypothetical protein [Myxococcus]|uniref:Muconolactone isomerase domain-containing protein n=1 Tax=Myxococcus llanfairpwllgwyngyllgogerychwyrndrobwllllantysiliogogogochensis TaxID=2590453 RepID=A0A540X8V5_9BACT|nr:MULTISPECIES: hypothetical protein [Myxococcus]NTX06851.1 hypothetical protein [Myxococcus sp. CA040A]NTX13840.1 hypothetical protein [Myxococcus sp. CA056]NTX38481.1 hypothetical protein [Myxococcus sp. CA033]NTX56333.1 hypothetical protein [Myxococcus sp. CA039A]TQF17741.1 hypothetical protein FJV41_01885 [Myxococcus llanfairpwllgwyngyllgogerychwyrndrobwllllantysiliogogogochensis]